MRIRIYIGKTVVQQPLPYLTRHCGDKTHTAVIPVILAQKQNPCTQPALRVQCKGKNLSHFLAPRRAVVCGGGGGGREGESSYKWLHGA